MSSGTIKTGSLSPMFFVKRKSYNVSTEGGSENGWDFYEPLNGYSLIGIVGISESRTDQRLRKWVVRNGQTGQFNVNARNTSSSSVNWWITVDLLYLKNFS